MKISHLSGQLAILLCAILWSTSGLFIKLVNWHPALIAGGRSFLAVFFLLAIRKSKMYLPSETTDTTVIDEIKNASCLPAGDIKALAVSKNPQRFLLLFTSGLWYAATMITFVIANKLTFSANAIVLQYTAPVWACLLGWIFLKEKPYKEHWLSLALVCIGMLLVFGNGLAGGSTFGDLLAIISGITFAANSVALRAMKNNSPLDVMICSHIICVFFSIPFYFIYKPEINTMNILSILFMGIFQIGAASALFVYGIKRVRAVQAMLTASIEPVLNPVWVLVVTGERPSLFVILGGAIIIAAVIISSSGGRQQEE